MDYGVEMALLNNKLKIDAAYFNKESKDVVYGIFQGTVSGAENWRNYVTNAYSFKNKGFEVTANYNTKINENINLGVYGNFTSLKNEITDVYGGSFLETGASLFNNSIIRFHYSVESVITKIISIRTMTNMSLQQGVRGLGS